MKCLSICLLSLLIGILSGGCAIPAPPVQRSGGPANSGPADGSTARLGEPFALSIGEQARLSPVPITLSFDDVNEDSRCPTKVNCFWSGRATVELTWEEPGQPPFTFTLSTKHSPELTDRTLMGDYGVRLMSLEPRAELPDPPIDKKDYVATFKVWKPEAERCAYSDDPQGYLTAVCRYVLENGIDVSPGDPFSYSIKRVEEQKSDDKTLVWVFLNCCGMGDIAIFDKETGAIVEFRVGAY